MNNKSTSSKEGKERKIQNSFKRSVSDSFDDSGDTKIQCTREGTF